jgi:hypothetical protein
MKTIVIIGGIPPSGRWVFFKASADFSKIDESKLQRFTFEVEGQSTRHSVAANGIVYEILERLGLVSPDTDDLKPGAYNAALRLAVAMARCQSLTTPDGVFIQPDLANMMSLPTSVLEQYQFELRQADELTSDELSFFHLADEPAPEKATDSEA